MSRKANAIRQTIATGLALVGLLFIVGKCTGCGLWGQRAVAAVDTAQYERDLDACLKEGREAKSLAVYTQCANEADKAHGVKDGGQ